MIQREKLPGRNTKCPCGSGKKAKRCCLGKIKMFAALPQSICEQIAVNRILRPILVPANPGGTITTADGISAPVESGEIIAIAEPLPETDAGPSGSYDFSSNGMEGR